MHHLASCYARYINRTYERIGHLFQGRFKAILVDADNYLSELVRYVHLNPVRAGVVAMPEDYPWSGHIAYVGLKEISWLSCNWILKAFHQYDVPARKLYAEYVKHGIGEEFREEFYCGSHEGCILGDDLFAERVVEEMHLRKTIGTSIVDLVNIVADLLQLPLSTIRSKGKRSEIAQARGIIALLVREQAHMSLKELANILDKDPSVLSRLASAIEQKAKVSQELTQTIQLARRKAGIIES